MYKISFTKQAQKQFEKLDNQIRNQIVKDVEAKLIQDIETYLLPLKEVALHKFRSGNYRLICKKQDKELIVLVVKVGHRKNVYENLNRLV